MEECKPLYLKAKHHRLLETEQIIKNITYSVHNLLSKLKTC